MCISQGVGVDAPGAAQMEQKGQEWKMGRSPPAQDMCTPTLVLAVLWVGLCALLVHVHQPQQPLLTCVFYAFALSFAAAASLRPLVRLAPGFSYQSVSALQAYGMQLLHAVLVWRLVAGENTYFSDHVFKLVAAFSAGFGLHRLWFLTSKGLFKLPSIAADMVYQVVMASWYITALCKESTIPLGLFAWKVALHAGISSAGRIFLPSRILAVAADTISYLCLSVPSFALLSYEACVVRRFDIVGSCFALLLSVCSVLYVCALWFEISVGGEAEATPTCTVSPDREPLSAPPPPAHLWQVHGQQYDLTPFVAKHPGGSSAILLGRGRDCSAMFESYHPFSDRHRKVLSKYTVDPAAKSVPSRAEADPFYDILCRRAAEALKEKGLEPLHAANLKASFGRQAYYAVIFCALLLSWRSFAQGHFFGPPLFALCAWLSGALGHDGSHFSVSSFPWVNSMMGFIGMGLIAQPSLWLHQHTFAHHSHTNDHEKDPDLHHFTFLRTHPEMLWESKYRGQARKIYVIVWWAFATFGESLYLPIYALVVGEMNSAMKVPFRLGITQILHLVVYMGLVVFAPLAGGGGVRAILMFWATSGILFGIFTQVNHLNSSSFSKDASTADNQQLRDSWAARQVETSNNFGIGNPIWFTLSNGLNYQIEHHLWPGMNHEHLWVVAPVVQRTCAEFGVRYKSYSSLWNILGDTMEHFKQLSEEPHQQ
jgi:fatty acid desaturase